MEKQKKGIGAGPASHRREYRRFRKPLPKAASSTICKFFSTPEGCKFGEKCRFKHGDGDISKKEELGLERKLEDELKIEETPVVVTPTIFHPPSSSWPAAKNNGPVISIPKVVKLKGCDVGTEAQKEQLAADVTFFRKRYRNGKFSEVDHEHTIQFRYMVTDPDWIFELKSLDFRIVLLPTHPVEMPKMFLPHELNQNIPEAARALVENRINESIEERHNLFAKRDSFETIGKQLIRWLDHNILRIFVEGLRRAKFALQGEDIGLKIIMPEKKVPVVVVASNIVESPKSPEVDEAAIPNSNQTEETKSFQPTDVLPIEIVMVWKDHSGNVATLRSTELKISTKCMRCQEERDSEVKVDDVAVGWRCAKCSQAQSLRIREEVVHSASNILGRMESKGCKPVDCILLDSKLKIVCLGCDKEDDLHKLNFGDVHKSWCRHCHALLELSIAHIRFLGSFENCSGEDKTIAGAIPKAKKVIEKRGAIEEGKPLPEQGTCEHYKKSYRWFRFPCCGKVYPCDMCHEVKTAGEHEMKIANRMVCGHCSKEQPFQKDKPCISCGEATTRRRTQFWEGGKGCRDPTKMNKNDAHKFVNTKKKTVAKSKVGSLATKNKK